MSSLNQVLNVCLKIDHREGKLKELFDQNNNIKCEYENLVFGDIQILLDDGIVFIFERKTQDDLLASIKDGRYKNQKANLIQNGFNTNQIYYIIEGTIKYETQKSSTQKIIQGAVLNTMLRDKISIINTKNLNETYELICNIYKRFCDDPKKYINSENNFHQTINVETSSEDSSAMVYKAMLCQIPSINEKSAQAIMDAYPTLKNLMVHLSSLSDEQKIESLSTLKVNGRKISKRIVENICKHL